MNLMYKTFVVKPREIPQFTYVAFTFFIYMFVVLSQHNFPNVITFTYQI